MDPSHAPRYEQRDIEAIAKKLLGTAYSEIEIEPPVDIDFVVENHPLVDSIIPVELLEDKFNVAAVLVVLPNGKIDILVDEDEANRQSYRANFSIAHELGHIALHADIWKGCTTIKDTLNLHKRINACYAKLERQANRFAGAFLMPRNILFEDLKRVYSQIVREYGYKHDITLINNIISRTLARRYNVTLQPMEIRLNELGYINKIASAVAAQTRYIDYDII